MNEPCPMRLLVADDHPIVRDGMVAILSSQPDIQVVGEASNGEEAIERFQALKPDVTLMDLRMPILDGIAATEAILEETPNARILVLTSFEGDEDIYRAIKAGARGYLLKTVPGDRILSAVRAIHSGERVLPPEVASLLANRMNRQSLTRRELEVLKCLADGKSNKEIGQALFITEGTVKAHINIILDKLEVSDRTQATLTALKRGLVHLSQA